MNNNTIDTKVLGVSWRFHDSMELTPIVHTEDGRKLEFFTYKDLKDNSVGKGSMLRLSLGKTEFKEKSTFSCFVKHTTEKDGKLFLCDCFISREISSGFIGAIGPCKLGCRGPHHPGTSNLGSLAIVQKMYPFAKEPIFYYWFEDFSSTLFPVKVKSVNFIINMENWKISAKFSSDAENNLPFYPVKFIVDNNVRVGSTLVYNSVTKELKLLESGDGELVLPSCKYEFQGNDCKFISK